MLQHPRRRHVGRRYRSLQFNVTTAKVLPATTTRIQLFVLKCNKGNQTYRENYHRYNG